MREFLLRKNDFFISYSSVDLPFADVLNHWLTETAGLKVFFDKESMQSGSSVRKGLAEEMSQCRGCIVLLSQDSMKSKWVESEIDQMLAEHDANPRFQVILLHLDNSDVSSNLNIRTSKWHELGTAGGPVLTKNVAAEILSRIHAFDGWNIRQDSMREVFVSRGWREQDDRFGDAVCNLFARRKLRLVGDLPDQDSTVDRRIDRIMRGCWGHMVVLPNRHHANGPDRAYKHFLNEIKISRRLQLPAMLVGDSQSDLPECLEKDTYRCDDTGENITDDDVLRNRIEDFMDDLKQPQAQVHAFFSSEYRRNENRNRLARMIVESTGTLPCMWGQDYPGDDLQGTIRDAIANARFVVADLSAEADRDMQEGKLRENSVNVNACIEAGICWGASVPLIPLAAYSSDQLSKMKHVPFMFRNSQVHQYCDDTRSLESGVEFLGVVHREVARHQRKNGRRVINYELTEPGS